MIRYQSPSRASSITESCRISSWNANEGVSGILQGSNICGGLPEDPHKWHTVSLKTWSFYPESFSKLYVKLITLNITILAASTPTENIVYSELTVCSFTFEMREPFEFEWILIGWQCIIVHHLKKIIRKVISVVCFIIIVVDYTILLHLE